MYVYIYNFWFQKTIFDPICVCLKFQKSNAFDSSFQVGATKCNFSQLQLSSKIQTKLFEKNNLNI